MFTTPTQFAILALLFVAGWFFGLASHTGGRKWRERYAAEREAHAATRRDADARVTAAETRHRDLEREHARLRDAAPVTAATVAPATRPGTVTTVAPSDRPVTVTDTTSTGVPIASSAARPAYAPGERRGWFDWGSRPRT